MRFMRIPMSLKQAHLAAAVAASAAALFVATTPGEATEAIAR